MDQQSSVPPALDAATVVLLRDGVQGLEVYLMRRVAAMRFAPGMYVFPGGRVEDRDYGDVPVSGAPDLRGASGDAVLVCAARETFEETGVLITTPSAVANESSRTEIESGGDFASLLRGLSARVDARALPMWAHWVTPEIESKRFDVRFYVAAVPAGQSVRDVSGEADHVRWIRPADALALHAAGELPMLPPTSATLADLEVFGSAAAAVAHAVHRTVEPLLPHRAADGRWSIIHAYDRSVIHPVTEARIISEVAGVRRTGPGGVSA
jgi:8-oxo-dGTP pyrophosphatase MutT (NUDIX family)